MNIGHASLPNVRFPIAGIWLRAIRYGADVDRTVADLNIAHFKKLLSAEVDPVKRKTIERLLAEEEAKVQAQPPKDDSSARKT